MAKKHPVKYSYGSPNAYNNLAVKDEYTVYFIIDADGYGTLYKGVNCLGSVDAAKIYFVRDVTARLGDTSYTIAKGTSVQDAFKDLYADMLRQTASVQDDVLAYVDETYAKPADIDSALYDFKNGYLKDNYYDKEETDARYVPGSELENIRQLAVIFSDDEKMQQLIDAAEGIDAILSNYYDKDYIDSSVDNVLTFDSSAEFPDVGKINKIYIDDEGNTMYRWAQEFDGLPDRAYVPISGAGGGGGGGGSDVKVEAAIYIKGAKTNDSVATGTPYTLEFAYSSANTFTSYNKETGQFEKVVQQTGKTGAAKYFIDGIQFASGSVRQANYDDADDSKNVYNTFVIPAARFTGSQHVIKIQVTDIAGNVATEEVTISLISVAIRSSYLPNPISLSKEIDIPVTVASSNSADVYYNVDDEGDVKAATIATGAGSTILTISPVKENGQLREHGVHNIKIWATTYIPQSDTTLETNILEYNTIWYDINNPAPIIASSIDAEEENGGYKSTQYEFVTITYQVYPASLVKLCVKDNNTGAVKVVNSLNVNTQVKNWSYTFDEQGIYTLYIEAIYGINMTTRSTEYVVNVKKAAYSLEATEGSDMFFTAKGRSNDEDPAVRQTWEAEIGNLSATLEGFAWNSNSGWYQNENTTALRVAGGARCTIPYTPFDSDYRSTGQVIEFDFSTSNLSDSTTTVISCFSDSDNSGIVINANNAYFTSSEFSLSDSADSRIKVPFKENERIRIAFVITPLNSDDAGNASHEVSIWDAGRGTYVTKDSVAEGWWRFVKVYVNGICTAVNQYSAANSFVQQRPAQIVIGSDNATIDIYSIRSYKKALYDKALVNNYVADTQDPAERMRLYLRNNILKDSGIDIDYSKLLQKMPCLFITCESDVTDLTYGYANAEHILPMNKKDKRGYTVVFNCDMLDEEAREYYDFCHSFVAYNAQMTVQGTSSQYYPRKNYKLKIKPQKKLMDGGSVDSIADYNKILATKKPTLFFWDTLGSSQGQSGTGGTPDGKLNRMNDAATYSDKYHNKYILKDFSLSNHEYQNTASITSVPATEFCLKADFAEASSTHNTGLAKYADYILKNMGYSYLTPPQKAEYNKNENNINKVSTRTTVDGYPIAMFWRRTYDDDYEFIGKYNFNIDKGAEDVFGFTGDIVEKVEYTNPMTGQPFSCFDEDYYDAASKDDRMAYESPVECWEFTNNSAEISKFNNVTDESFREPSEEYGMEWLGSFEGRHPDNDNFAADLAAGKDPVHWRKFMTWVSSTNREGFHDAAKTLKIPYAWNGTLEELRAGDTATESFLTYNGTLDEMNADDHTVFDYNSGYILEPLHIVDEATQELGPDDSYLYFGYIARYNSETHLWYVDGKYEEDASAIDNTKWYYINNADDTNYKNVYKYASNDWTLVANLDADYLLPSPVTYNSTVYKYDNADFRLAKFANELPNHMNINVTTAYYVLTEFFACVDQRAKNMMFASWGYESPNTRPASAFADEAAANAAGYKGVYKYEVAAVNSAPNPMVYSAPKRGGDMVLGAAPATVCINEIDATNKKMEFYNPTASAITLTGYTLKGVDDKNAARDDWSFPSGATIDAGGYYVITFKSAAEHPELGPAYGLSPTKKWSFTLEDGTGTTIDTISKAADVDITNKSLGRETDGAETWVEFDAPTIGAANAPSGDDPVGIPTTELTSHLSYTTNTTELSGLCFNADKTALFGVGDNGTFYRIGFDGTTTEVNIVDLADEDLEGITIDVNGDLFAINEGTGKVWKIAGPDYNTAVEAFTVTMVGTASNGYEGIAAFGNQFLVGNQKGPIALYTVPTSGGAPTLLKTLDCVTEIADLEFDGTNIWVLDSNEATLAKLDATGELVEKFSMPFVPTSGSGPEALAIDGNTAYVGCDNSNSDFFKVSLTNDPLTTTVVMNEFDPDLKVIEFYNTTSDNINLANYTLVKENDETTKFTFSDVTIAAHGYLVIPLKSDGVEGPTFGLSGTKGFEYKLFDTEGNVVDRVDNITNKVEIPDGFTYGRKFDGVDEFALFKNGTIGSTNGNGVVVSGIYINEVDTTGNVIGKRFEIYNANSTAYDLTGHSFVKDGSEWAVVGTAVGEGLGLPTTIVPANGYLVVQCCNNKNADTETGAPKKDKTKWPDFGLSGNKGFVLEIKNAEGSYIDRVNNLMENVINPNGMVPSDTQTWGRASDGEEHNFVLFDTPNLGSANTGGTVYTATRVEGSTLFINEIDCTNDRFEIYNAGDEAVDLSGYIISKNGEAATMWAIPDGAVAAHGYFTVNCKQWNTAVGPTFGLSATNGFYLTLADATGAILDVVNNRKNSDSYISPASGHTIGRETDGANNWIEFETGSIGQSNANGTPYVPETVDPGDPITDHVVLNEIAYRQIELYNPTSGSVDIGGLWLVKTPQAANYNEGLLPEGDGRSDAWQIPAGTSIPSKGFVVFKCQDTTPGPDFGISFKAGKDFDLYLMRNIGAMATATGAQSIDQSLVVDHISNYENPVVDPNNAVSIGRVKDGYTTICRFNTTSIGETNNNSIPIPIDSSEDTPSMGTIKTPLYWVPIDCEYIYYPIFYDNDTILSLNNTGYIRYEPNVESTDKIGTGYAYNGTESVLWLNFKDAFATGISSTYATMRASGGLDYAQSIHYFNETQSDLWPEVLYNLDAKFKYVDPATVGYIDFSQRDDKGTAGVTVQEGGYLYECQGSRAEHRKWWLTNRFIYMDSRYNTGSTYHDAYATMRLYTPAVYNPIVEPNAEFTLTPYTDMYLRVRFGSVDAYVRAEKNKPYKVTPPPMRFNNTETIIYGAPYILSFGQLADKYADSVAIGNATKITDILLGWDSPYYNENLTNLTVSATNTSLKNIDVRGCKKLSLLNGLQQINTIESVKATDTAITNIDFSTTGANLRSVAYPASIATVKLVNMNYITNAGISFVNYKNLSTLWIENCPNINTWTILERIIGTTGNVLANVRLTGFIWNIQTQTEFNTWKTLLTKRGIADDTTYSLNIPYLTGVVNIGAGCTVSSGYKDGIEEMFRQVGCNLIVNVSSTTGLSGIQIDGPVDIVPNRWYTYTIKYLPDDFVLASDKGVTWTIDPDLRYRSMTASSVEVMFEGSTSGTRYYDISAVSSKYSTMSASLSIAPSATLQSIQIMDSTNHEIDYNEGISLYEGETQSFTIVFTPSDTTDDELDFVVSNPEYLVHYGANAYEYSSTTRTLSITGADVSRTQAAAIRISSKNLPTINRSIPIHVYNIVSRVIYLQDETRGMHERIPGYADVQVDGDSNIYRIKTSPSNVGVITMPTNVYDPENGCFGLRRLVVNVESTYSEQPGYYYNKPASIVMEELPAEISKDDEYTVSFYKPITANITVLNSNKLVTDKRLLIESLQNTSIRNLTEPPFNKVIVTASNNPATVKLLANTMHEITITELEDDVDVKVTRGGRYSQYIGSITTGTGEDPFNYSISISRDYLGNYTEYEATELHMTVVTGSGNYRTVRIYYNVVGPIIIDWGDAAEQTSGAHLDAITGDSDGEKIIYHTYQSANTEYDITVTPIERTINGVQRTSNTQNIKWFHVISEGNVSGILPCFGTGTSSDLFPASWSDIPRTLENPGGLVAYQSNGAAVFRTMPRFNISNKDYSKLISVGNIYKTCVDCTSADSLFENTTLEQIPTSGLFNNCVNIVSFNKTFKNTNLTTLPANFFVYNTKAVSFEETFANCTLLSTINSEEDIPFLHPADDVEIVSLKRMFAGCESLISRVPGFWKTFYGCSFADAVRLASKSQKSFEGCVRAGNYDSIPYSWGGNTSTPEYTQTARVNPLKYIHPGRANGLTYFELGGIPLCRNYRYEYVFKNKSSDWYEVQPLFGAATADDVNDESTITSVTDFHRGGSGHSGKANIFTGYFTYRNGSPATKWNVATTNGTNPAAVFAGDIGRNSDIIVLDICHTQDNKVKIYRQSDPNNFNIFNVDTWSYEDNTPSNLPLRIYYTYFLNNALDYRYEDPTAYVAQDLYFYELKIYNGINELIHDIVPGYAVINNVSAPVMYDKLDDSKVYPATGPGSNYIEYYIK